MSILGSNENQNELLLYFLVLKIHINWLECGNVGNNTNILKLWKKRKYLPVIVLHIYCFI